MVIRSGERIAIRKLVETDAEAIQKNISDEDILTYTQTPNPYKLSDAEWFIEKSLAGYESGKEYNFGIVMKGSTEVIGMISLMHIGKKHQVAELGYWIAKKHWGQGIMKEAVSLILSFGFEEVGLKSVHAYVAEPNARSAGVLLGSGFKEGGVMRRYSNVGGKWYDSHIYDILPEEFKQ